MVDAGDASATTVQIAEDVSLVLIGDGAFDLHDGLQQHGCCEAHGFAEGFPSGHAGYITILILSLWPAFGDKMRWLGVGIILAVCWSRMALGVHFPADLLAGFLIAAIEVLLLRKIIYGALHKLFGLKC